MNAIKTAKREVVNEIKSKLEKASAFVIIDYKGLTVGEDTDMRNNFRAQKVEYKVLKNTLVKIALNELGFKDFDASLNGPTAVAMSFDDAIAPAKVAVTSIKKYNKMQIKCGMVDKKFIDGKTVEVLASIPGKEVLLAMLLSVLQSPMRGLAVSLNEIAKNAQ